MDEDRIAFPHFTDLSTLELRAAVAAFGRMLQKLVGTEVGV